MKWAHKKSGMAFSGDFFSVDPARAGMIPEYVEKLIDECSGPRASGDDPAPHIRIGKLDGWTPRERG